MRKYYLVINFLIFFVFLELSALVFFAHKEKKFFYISDFYGSNKDVNIDDIFDNKGVLLSPFFGYTSKPDLRGVKVFTNNYGFKFNNAILSEKNYNSFNYPYEKEADEIVVGVFGGSVAMSFAYDLQASNYLKQLFPNKKFRILQFAEAGYKQPQQLLIYQYFLSIGQEFDIVINFDGFNELTTSPSNIAYGVDPRNVATYIYATRAELLLGEQDCLTAACWLFSYVKKLNTVKSSPSELIYESFSLPKITAKPYWEIVHSEDTYRSAIEQWYQSSIMMGRLSAINNIKYIHVIQPNQWFRDNLEPYVSSTYQDHLAAVVPYAYRMLERRIAILEQEVLVLDLIHEFDNLQSNQFKDVYLDDCCHFTISANFQMADKIFNLKNF
jgi:hypothetical protein